MAEKIATIKVPFIKIKVIDNASAAIRNFVRELDEELSAKPRNNFARFVDYVTDDEFGNAVERWTGKIVYATSWIIVGIIIGYIWRMKQGF